ncbi:hypothetical protein [Metallosphaera hakonensis]|uniref:Uncharacterized protein n=1 Tax=Metallosphaera hakonensis JCM 8857 = DSM 7519 TaxID=1293036 RepID=A0A2U9ISM9_9CREN|nr:hypothetical protein [Metallosphaera hakonensis]AWR99028.1 hypothetical protein DFR87_04220 [Metallosphaera hakonensis JCM 8857 = DSM 7519]
MDKIELLSRLLVEQGFVPNSFEDIERGFRIRLSQNSYIDVMESGITLLYIAKSIPCAVAQEYRERIRDNLNRLTALNIVAGIELLSDGCYLALLRKLNSRIMLNELNNHDLTNLYREYINTLKVLPLITGISGISRAQS